MGLSGEVPAVLWILRKFKYGNIKEAIWSLSDISDNKPPFSLETPQFWEHLCCLNKWLKRVEFPKPELWWRKPPWEGVQVLLEGLLWMEMEKGRRWLQAVPPGAWSSAGCIPCGFILLYSAKGMVPLIRNSCLSCGKEGFACEKRHIAPQVKCKSEFRVGKRHKN